MDDPAKMRREYAHGELLERDVSADPIEQFRMWFEEAIGAGAPEPNAMTLATVDAAGAPAARIVLLKGFDHRGFVFYTNYDSRKGREMAANPRVAVCFHWPLLERQVRIEGSIEKVSRQESEEYFHSRPIASQIAAWVSHQSEAVESREALEKEFTGIERRFAGNEIPLPEFWGGYRIAPKTIEFWQGRRSRLHDRLQYVKADGAWTVRRLAP